MPVREVVILVLQFSLTLNRWYTSMLGLASSVENLVRVLQELKVSRTGISTTTSR